MRRTSLLHLLAMLFATLLLAGLGPISCGDSSGSEDNDTMSGDAEDTGDVSGDGDDMTTDTGDVTEDGDTDPGDAGDMSDMDTCPEDRECGNLCCEADTYCINGQCRDSCSSGVTCGPTDGLCCASNESCLDDDTCGLACPGGTPACGSGFGATCCEADEVCQNEQCVADCGDGVECNGVCCGADEMCYQDQCAAQCEVASLCGENNELCCAAAEVCLGGTTCVEPGDPCTLTEQCAVDELCEPTLGACIPRDAVEVCEFIPPVGQFEPTTACQWSPAMGDPLTNFDDVVMTPAVANLTDDNGDGVTDTLDMPDIVFTSFDYQSNGCCTANGRLRIISGGCNPDGTMNTIWTLESESIDNSGGVAIGNLHPDSNMMELNPEIVATGRTGVMALRRLVDDGSDWEIMWRNNTYPSSSHTRGGAVPAIADLNGDGSPEVVIGNLILNGQDGSLIMDGNTVMNGDGIGNNAFLGPAGTVADLDLDGIQEVIAGNTVYEWDGQNARVECSYTYTGSNSACQGNLPCDGFNGVGNFDADPEGEIVIVREGQVFVLDHDCNEKHVVDIPRDDVQPYLGDGPCSRNESGPPTVADFDGDGEPEIGSAGADFYVVVDLQCVGSPLPAGCRSEKILWATPNRDCSSRATASSVFDFEGDGKAEVVYADETTFRILDGTNGNVLYEDTSHSSNTRIEMPLVVDVDNDGKSEVVIPEPNRSSTSLGGIEIWEDVSNNWVRTRRIWNQHGYYVTNVTEDGQIPRQPEINWLNGRLNNFRQNVQPGGLFDAPDLVVEDISVDLTPCNVDGSLNIVVTVRNDGALGVPAGILVSASVDVMGMVTSLGNQATTQPLLPGQSTQVVFNWTPPQPGVNFTVGVVVDDDGMGNGQYNECEEMNNDSTSVTFTACNIQ